MVDSSMAGATALPSQSREAWALERQSDRSLYEQIVDRLRELVSGSETQTMVQVPTEDELTRMFGVSRATVRKAIDHLVEEKVLVRRRGKGTFVSRPLPRIVHPIDRVAPFFDTFQQAGEDIHTEITNFSWDDGAHLPAQLSDWQRPILNIQRRYVSRNIPHAITQISVPAQIGARITREQIASAPIYQVLEKLGIELSKADFLVSCRQPSIEISKSLDVSPSTFLLVLDRVTRDAGGTPVESMTHFLRPDVYQLSVSSEIGNKSLG